MVEGEVMDGMIGKSLKRKWKFLVPVIGATAAVVTLFLVQSSIEPRYQGKTVSEWLDGLGCARMLKYQFYSLPVPPDDSNACAIAYFGSNAVPAVLRHFHEEDHPYRRWLGPAGNLLLGPKYESPPHVQGGDREKAYKWLCTLGPAAADAVPDLVIASRSSNWVIQAEAIILLGNIHSRADIAVPALKYHLQNTDYAVSLNAACALAEFGSQARDVVPLLILQRRRAKSENTKKLLMDQILKINADAAAKEGNQR